MCGLAGIFRFKKLGESASFEKSVQAMSDRMIRRGPDDAGRWSDPDGNLFLGFRRLAILDLTESGHQPMCSADGRSVIVFNGEIYNHHELRLQLEARGIRFRSHSDTEVLLEALNEWGTEAVGRLNGMFAFAWYDRRERRLVLARDHAGIKPLYYGWEPGGKGMVFGSQFDFLGLSPWGQLGEVREDVLTLYLKLQHIPPPYGLHRNTYQLGPGELLEVGQDGSRQLRKWWQLPLEGRGTLSGRAAVERVSEAVERSVRRQRIADVPLGVFLSGGIDSQIVAAVARKQAGPGLKSFTIGNPGWRQDESEIALTFAKHLDLQAHVHNASAEDVLDRLKQVVEAQHEPFADFSILPTLQVSQFARSEVTVALSGDGGDELFFGYERPSSLLRGGMDFALPAIWRKAVYKAGRLGIGRSRSGSILSKDPGDYYFGVNCHVHEKDLALMAPGLGKVPDDFHLYDYELPVTEPRLADYSRRVEYYGQLQRGLKKVDMASMHMSLEVRVPMLDREVIDASFECDSLEFARVGQRKPVLRQLLGTHVPPDSIPIPKRGFAVPLGDGLRGPLKGTVEEVLFGGELFPSGVFDRRRVEQIWARHLSGQSDDKWLIWTLLCLQWWSRRG